MKILVLNPGSTSLKLAIYQDQQQEKSHTLRFDKELLEQMRKPENRIAITLQLIHDYLKNEGIRPENFDCAVSRGGVLGKVKPGAYAISEKMVDFVRRSGNITHSVGVILAYEMMRPLGKPCFIYDAVSADEWEPMCKLTGLKGHEKVTNQHTLNTRQVARQVAENMGKTMEEVNVIVAHLGGGIDTTFFRRGRIVESMGYNELGFATDRCGAIHYNDLIRMAQGKTVEELQPLNRGKGGLMSHLGTASVEEAEKLIDAGDEYAAMVLEAMAYRVAQCIAAGAAALCGEVDAIVLTGGIAHSKRFTGWIIERVKFICPVTLIPGEMETQALASGAYRVMIGQETAQEF